MSIATILFYHPSHLSISSKEEAVLPLHHSYLECELVDVTLHQDVLLRHEVLELVQLLHEAVLLAHHCLDTTLELIGFLPDLFVIEIGTEIMDVLRMVLETSLHGRLFAPSMLEAAMNESSQSVKGAVEGQENFYLGLQVPGSLLKLQLVELDAYDGDQ